MGTSQNNGFDGSTKIRLYANTIVLMATLREHSTDGGQHAIFTNRTVSFQTLTEYYGRFGAP